jgi:hypothetical protein
MQIFPWNKEGTIPIEMYYISYLAILEAMYLQ